MKFRIPDNQKSLGLIEFKLVKKVEMWDDDSGFNFTTIFPENTLPDVMFERFMEFYDKAKENFIDGKYIE